MDVYVYCWRVRPEAGLTLDLRMTAPNVIVARREIRRFLVDHAGDGWTVECVTRETRLVPHLPVPVPPARH